MAATQPNHGVSVTLIDDASQLPPITGRKRNDLVISRDNSGWILDFTPGVGLFWRQFLTPGGGSSKPSIVLVVADKTGKYAPFDLSSAVYDTLGDAVAALPTGGAAIILLDDTYSLGATQALPENTTLFGFSREGVIITSSLAGATLEPAGNLRLQNVTVINGGAGPAIAPTSAGTIDVYESTVGVVDASASNVATALNVSNNSSVNAFVGGAQPCSVTANSSSISTITLPAPGSSVVGRAASIGTLNCNGSVDLQQGDAASIGTVNAPSVTATGVTMTGSAYNVTTATFNGCRFTGVTPAIVSSGGSVSLRNCYMPTGSITSSSDIVLSFGSYPAATANAGIVNAVSAVVSGVVNALTLATGKSSFSAAVSVGTMNADETTFTSTIAVATTANIRSGSHCSGKITLAANANLSVENSTVLVAVAGGGSGAIVNAGGTVNLIDSYVRANDSLLSVSGTGNVVVTRGVAGGCFFGTGLTISTVSGVNAENVRFGTLSGPATIQSVTGQNEVVDHAHITPTLGSQPLTIYSAAILPLGFKLTISNGDYTSGFGIRVTPDGSETINGSNTFITLSAANTITLKVISSNAWVQC